MGIERAIHDELLKDDDVTDIVDDRVYYQFPRSDDFPRITITRISTERQMPLDPDQPDPLVEVRLQIDCWAEDDYAEAKDLADAVRALFTEWKWKRDECGEEKIKVWQIKLENEQDDKNPPLGGSDDPLFRVIQDYRIFFYEDHDDGQDSLTENQFGVAAFGEGSGTTVTATQNGN